MNPRFLPIGIVALAVVVGCNESSRVGGPALTTDGPNQVLVKVAGMT